MPDRNYCYITFDQLDLTLGKTANKYSKFAIKRVIFNAPATIVLWADGTKTVVKCGEKDEYDPEKGLAMCIAKKALGNEGNYYNVFKEWLPEETKKDSKTETNTDLLSSIWKVSETLRHYFDNDSQ